MSNKRTNFIYENCCVYSPEGKLMFRCLEKRARWYLDRNLAVMLEKDPLSVRLTFTPKGNGEKEQHLKHQRENKCVVCGEKDLNVLTRHHLVPYEYRKHFPDNKKKHNSLYIVPICRKCHDQYNIVSRELNKQFETECNAPINGISRKKIPSLKALTTLIANYDKLPKEKIERLKRELFYYLQSKKMVKRIEDIGTLEKIKNVCQSLETKTEFTNLSHGQIVVNHYTNDLDKFEKMWIDDFIIKMKPKYMPKYLSDLSGDKSLFNNLIKKFSLGRRIFKVFINRFWNLNKRIAITVF